MAPPQQQEGECGRAAGTACVWLVTALLLLAVLGGGGCLVAYVVLPPSDAPGWLPAVALALVALPWAFWLATCAYRCVTTRSGDLRAAAVAPAATSSLCSRADSPASGS